jgi:hypothetical protein
MLAEYPIELRCFVCALAVWRLTHLVVAEDGPWDSIFKLRKALGDGAVGRAMDCFYCTSAWCAVPFAFLVAEHWPSRIASWLALSGAASLLEQATSRNLGEPSQGQRAAEKEVP